MSSEKDEKDQGAQEVLLYWAVALVGLIALRQLWTEKLRPWIEGTWGRLRAGDLVNIPIVGRVDQADAIGIAVLAVLLLIALVAIVGEVRRRNRATATAKSRD